MACAQTEWRSVGSLYTFVFANDEGRERPAFADRPLLLWIDCYRWNYLIATIDLDSAITG